MERRLKVLAVAPYCDGLDVGEAWCAFQWVKNLATIADVTLLTVRREGWIPASQQLQNVEVVQWDEQRYFAKFERVNSMLKPGYLSFYRKARKWITAALAEGRTFDVAHQFSPVALRYPSPLAGFPIPYVIGPLAGSLNTPSGFESECRSAAWFTQLRSLDQWRLKRDRVLRQSYSGASALLGVAPYVGELLAPARPQRFEVISELGIDNLALPQLRDRKPGTLRMVHVGRGVRTKGLRDAIRAIALLPDELDVQLDVAGRGEEISLCKEEARQLGVDDRVNFRGQIAREEVEELYEQGHVFLFPSFREPSGSVIFEALRHGLPVITTNRGGPGHVIDESCGLTVPVHTPEQLAADLAEAIELLARDVDRCNALSDGALRRIEAIGLWSNKIQWLAALYDELIEEYRSEIHEVI